LLHYAYNGIIKSVSQHYLPTLA